ncbi:hypothetical protein O181_022303 [Austropuccinia psidii MF-1]|uniref:Integrase catalytic domain-containing protein n=1 Tax=Austropuccinia psidii MF-1 TaxID=1389203 RepID=A0A9Q3GW78_9BASI|nr:hypothetical protein [Austropuccinia psidii MF-1]
MNFQQLIKQDGVQPSILFAFKVEAFSNFIESIQKSLWKDLQYRGTLPDLGKGEFIENYSLDPSSNLLLLKDWMLVPNDPTIQLSILQNFHDSPLDGHPGQGKTLKLVEWDFHWSSKTQFIKYYVSSCQHFSRNKNIHKKNFGLLKPLPTPNGPWIFLSMDFITQVPLSNSFDSIMVIVERFSKMKVFIPTMSSINSLDLAHLIIKNIFPKHGLPSRILSARGCLFVSSFWINLCQQLNISRDPSASYHPETNGQTQRVNQILEQDPQFESIHITEESPSGNLSLKTQSLQQDVKRALEVAINGFKSLEESKHSCLPSQWNSIHPVFHIALLEPVKKSTIQNLHQKPPSPIIIEEEKEREFSKILDSKINRGELWYLVELKCLSQDSERSTWEPTEKLKNFPELVKYFQSLYPDKSGPNSSRACFL